MKKKVIREFILHFLIIFIGSGVPLCLFFWLSGTNLKFYWWILIIGWITFISLIYAFCYVLFLKEHYRRVNRLWKQKSYRQSVYQYFLFLLIIKLLLLFLFWLLSAIK